MSKIFNPSTRRYVKDNEGNRKKIEAIAKEELFNIATEESRPKEKRMIDNFWDTFIQPAIIQENIAKAKARKIRRRKILSIRAKNKVLEQTLRNARTDVVKYKYTYSIRFYEEGDLYTAKNTIREGAVQFESVTLKTVNKSDKIVIASAVRLEQKMYKIEKLVTDRRRTGNVQISELHKAIDDTQNYQFKNYFNNLTISDDRIVGMLVSKEKVIAYKPNFRFDANVLYNTENVGVVGTNNYFELNIDKANKCFTSNAVTPSDVPMACMYNVIMRLGVKINEKYSTAQYIVSMESIARDCEVTERFTKGDFGMTINEALKWFKRYNISLSCYDIFYTQMFHWENNGKRNKHNLKACSVMIHNGHAFYLSDNAKRSLTNKQEKHEDIRQLKKPSDSYSVKDKTKQQKTKSSTTKEVKRQDVFKKSNTIDNVFEEIFALEENQNLHIYCIEEDLMNIVKRMMFDYGITPNVNGKCGQIKSIELILINNLVRIYTIHTVMIPLDVLENISIEEYTAYCKEREKISSMLINDEYKSSYNERVLKAFKHYSRGSVRGTLEGAVIDMNKKYYGLDACKSYSNLLNVMEYLIVTSIFDDFVSYHDSEINPYYFYIIRKVDEFQGSELIFDSDEIMTTGNTVLYLLEKLKVKIKIISEMKVCKLTENPLFNEVKAIFENSNYNIYLKKFLMNSIIGLLGRRHNTNRKMILSTDEEYIQNICQSYGELGISTYPIPIVPDVVLEDELVKPLYCFFNEQSTELKNGFYPIQFAIYDWQRITVFKTYKEVSFFTKPVAVNTDCIYFEKCEKLEEHMKGKYDGSFGSKKIEEPKTLCFINGVKKQRPSIVKDITCDYQQKTILIKDEYNLKEIASKLENKTLITSDIAGSGKSYCLQKSLDKTKTLYVTHYNKLAFTLKTKGYVATTFHKLTGEKIANLIDFERPELDVTGIENIVFEEIYSYDRTRLASIDKYMKKHNTISYYSTGDTFQLESINSDVNYEYVDMAIRKMFKHNIHFKIHKRDPKAHDFLLTLKHDLFNPVNKSNLIDIAKKYFRVVNKDYASEKAICYFNDSCKIVNNIIITKRRANNELLVGDELLCRKRLTTEIGDLIPNYIYRCIEINDADDTFTLFEPFFETKYILKKYTVHNHLRFTFSETAHSVQGETFDDKITVYDVNHSNWCLSPRWLYVALTRSSNIFENVTICCDVIHNNNIMNLNEKLNAYEVSDREKGFVFDERKYPRLTLDKFKQMFKQQRGCCAICGYAVKLNWDFAGDIKQYSIDRIDNNFIGGHCMSNTQITCLGCNVSKR